MPQDYFAIKVAPPSQATAEAGTNNDEPMTALRTKQQVKAVVSGDRCRCCVSNVTIEDTSSDPRFIEFFGGYMWGILSGDIYRSTDEGVTWTLYCNSWPGTGDEAFIARIIPTSDGEVLAMSGTQLRKSSGWANGNAATWSAVKISLSGTASFLGFSLDGDGTKFIAG